VNPKGARRDQRAGTRQAFAFPRFPLTRPSYSLAVSRPPKKDDKGEIVRDERGYAVRETDW
jgi:hypothetical protein